jgi:DNA mismatch repair protein MutS2
MEEVPMPANHVFKKNDWVRVISLNMDGQLLDDPRDGVVMAQVGAMRVTLPVRQMRPLSKTQTDDIQRKQERKHTNTASGIGDIALAKAIQISPELMLRAMRVDEAQSLLDKYVDDASAAGLSEARIIHGRGTGALRRVVHEFLREHPSVASFRVGDATEGGDGATIVTFRR